MTLRFKRRRGAERHAAANVTRDRARLEAEVLRLWILSLPPGSQREGRNR